MAILATTFGGDAELPEDYEQLIAGGFQGSLVWDNEFESELDPRVLVSEDLGIAVVFTSFLHTSEEKIYGLDIETGDRLWSKSVDEVPTIRFHDDVMYMHDIERLSAIEPGSGREKWTISGIFGNPSYFNGNYAVFSGDIQKATLVNLSNGSLSWQPDDENMVDPVSLSSDKVVFFGDHELAGYDIGTQERLWNYSDFITSEFDLNVFSSWPIGFVTSSDPGHIDALDLRTGELLWELDKLLIPWYFEGLNGNRMLLATENGTIHRFDLKDGTVDWSRDLTDGILSLYLVDGDMAVPVAEDQIWGISIGEGEVRWSIQIDSNFPFVRDIGTGVIAAGSGIKQVVDGDVIWKIDFGEEESLYPDVSGNRIVLTSGNEAFGFEMGSNTETPIDQPVGENDSVATSKPEPTGRSSPDTEITKNETPDAGSTTTRIETPGFGGLVALLGIGGYIEYLRRKANQKDE